MTKTAFFLLVISMFLLVSACSKSGGDPANTREVVELDDLSAEEKEKLFRSSGILLRDNPTLAENLSRIETSHNEQGIKVERYFYKNLPNLKYIEIFSMANGQKQIFIHTANGNIKSLSENSLAWLAKASPEEITSDAPVAAAAPPQKENSSSELKVTTLPPVVIQTTPQSTPNQPAQPKTEANVKTDTPAGRKESKTQPN